MVTERPSRRMTALDPQSSVGPMKSILKTNSILSAGETNFTNAGALSEQFPSTPSLRVRFAVDSRMRLIDSKAEDVNTAVSCGRDSGYSDNIRSDAFPTPSKPDSQMRGSAPADDAMSNDDDMGMTEAKTQNGDFFYPSVAALRAADQLQCSAPNASRILAHHGEDFGRRATYPLSKNEGLGADSVDDINAHLKTLASGNSEGPTDLMDMAL
ncbi:hypothetical protein B0H14DRAFT_2952237 [Mycena olivaceomarginata]|nr:hypothetical protein B0H14DRAFT_2952237 [Mycena olivaceomarginata]